MTTGEDGLPVEPYEPWLPDAPGAPPYVKQGQSYYWTRAWQADEEAAADELDRGATKRFSDLETAISWLRQAPG